jgi:DNA topoisomerase I
MTVVERLQGSGIRRSGSPKTGFLYLAADGAAPSTLDRTRIRRLAVPPAWTEAWISGSASSRVQAIGRDRAGRWQYLYSENHARRREQLKRERLLAFLRTLPQIRARVARDLGAEGLARQRVLAAMVRILLRGFVRPGSAVYTRENGTYGLSTLRHRHARVHGQTITLSYIGKGKKAQRRRIADPAAARVVAALLARPGRSLFCYRDEEGRWVTVRRRHVNDYLHEIAGSRFSAKDFRTWAGTLIGACALAQQGYPEPRTDRAVKKAVAAAMRETARLLGNTPAVCRASYVSPAVVSSFERGRLLAGPIAAETLLHGSAKTLLVYERRLSRLIREGKAGAPRSVAA